MNTWFKQFLESFGECECRKITEKQFQCFACNMHEHHFDSKYGIRYGLETENLRIRAEKFSSHTQLATSRSGGLTEKKLRCSKR